MRYLFTICGRAGSKGLKNKNVGNFNEIPLVYYSLAALELVAKQLISQGHQVDFALNTDSVRLVELVEKQRNISVLILLRPTELSGDKVAKVTVIKDSMLRAQEHWGCTYDFVIDLDLTSPLRTKDDVLSALEIKERNRSTDVVYSLAPARKNPYFNMAKRVGGHFEKVIHANYISRQETPEVFDMNASIYVYEPRALLEKEPTGFFNTNADAVIMRDTGVLDIDCKEDLEMMEVLAKHLFYAKYPEYTEIYDTAKKMYENCKTNELE